LVGQGIDSILTLTQDPLPSEWVNGLPLELGHIPMEDHSLPDVESLDKGADYVASKLQAGKTLLVHCLAGEGRTGCTIAAYLIKDRGLSAADALKKLREVKPAFVESAQEKAVIEYGARLRHG